MGEEPLVETRLAISAQKVELERTADQLRDALDVKKRFQENPALVLGLGGRCRLPDRRRPGARREARPAAALPLTAREGVRLPPQADAVLGRPMAGTIGPRAAEARQSLSEELQRWRHDPKRKHGRSARSWRRRWRRDRPARSGRPGPRSRRAQPILTAALARKAVERFLSGEPPSGIAPLDAVGTVGGAAKPDPKHAKNDLTKPPEQRARAAVADAREDYSGISSRDR